MSNILAGVYVNELVSLNKAAFILPGRTPQYTSPQNLTHDALAANYWSVVYTLKGAGCSDDGCNLNIDEIAAHYLVQIQSWYGLANYGDFDPDLIAHTLIQQSATSLSVGLDAVDHKWQADDTVPHQWGNYGYGQAGYPNYGDHGLRDNSAVLYCVTIREFKDGGELDTASHPPDIWNDYRSVIIKLRSLGLSTSTYSYAYPLPWLSELGNPPMIEGRRNYYRNNLPNGRDFLPC